MEKINPHKLKLNKANPRFIKDENYKKLVESIKEFPEMLAKRPIVVDEDLTVLGGNMRLRACREAGLKEVPYSIATGWTEDQKKEFIIKDNISYGNWNWDMLFNEWDTEQLKDWGMDFPSDVLGESEDYSDKNKEVDIDELDGTMVIKLNYLEKEYLKVKDQLAKIASTPEQAVWKLLGNE